MDANLVYRVLRPNENWQQGIRQQSPNAGYQIVQHLNGMPRTQYISASRTLQAAQAFAIRAREYIEGQGLQPPNSFTIVSINTAHIQPNNIIDLTIPATLDEHVPEQQDEMPNQRGYNSARRNAEMYKEVLIKQAIPSEYIAVADIIRFGNAWSCHLF